MGPLWSQGLEAISVSYDALGKIGIEGSQRERHCLERLRKDVDEIVLVDLYLLGSNVGPLRSQRSEGTSVSLGCFGRDWIEGSQRKRHCLRNFCATSVSIGCRRECSHH